MPNEDFPLRKRCDQPLLVQGDCNSWWWRHLPEKSLSGHWCRQNCQQVPGDFSDQRVRRHVSRPPTKWTLVVGNCWSCDVWVQLVLSGRSRATRSRSGGSIVVKLRPDDALEVTDDDAVGCGDSDGELGVAVATAATVFVASAMYIKVRWWHSSLSNGAVLNRRYHA